MSWRETLAHAFAVRGEPLAAEDEALLDRAAAEIRRRGLIPPAVLFLESLKPLNFVGSQAMVFLQPIVGVAFSTGQWARLASVLERREAIDLLLRRLEGGVRAG